MTRNPLIGAQSYEELRLEMLIRTAINERSAQIANNVYDTMRYIKRARTTHHCHTLHQDVDTTDNLQLIETHIDPSDLTEI